MRYVTRSVTGAGRNANHDSVAVLCEGGRGVFVIADGFAKPGSGQLSERFVRGVLTLYQKHIHQGVDDTEHAAVEKMVRSVLAELHAALFARQTGSACYLIGVAAHGKLTLAYEGDCSCGVVMPAGMIEWMTPPHCKVNWRRDRSHHELAEDPARHRVTRCFKANRVPDPEFVFHPMSVGERVVFATDGFWAELTPVQQSRLLAAPDSFFAPVDDDVTWIDVKLL